MSPTNAIKMINIQKSYSVYFGCNQSILSSSVHFGFICLWLSYWVHIGPILYFSPIQSTLVIFSPFSPLRSYSIHSILFGPFYPLWSYIVNIGPIQSTMVMFGSLCPIRFHLFLFSPYVHFGPNLSIRSYSVHFGSNWSTLFPFGPIMSIRSTSFHLVHLCPLQSILVHFGSFYALTYKENICLDWKYLF